MRALLLLLLQLAAASAASITIKEGIPGQVCFVQPLPFASKSFSYTVTVDPSSIELQEGCDASQILYVVATLLKNLTSHTWKPIKPD